ncbi:hypothetical protein BDZ90DRAFT_104778 [Jaminaea rosea]|uniref:Uncharacterized protein n=1 Tax=Jaminaea rosea TaxID=1569628 RepID=A0A316UVI9_9BASI|nr:hypothetical protein BDZ90DRAFT_104778 [Jaminaea rosea]PWN29289.1 hypothetical protein BDZ90DRAFT_104778 [Jaminaea rosea]
MPSLVHKVIDDYAARRLRSREMAALRQWKLDQVRHQMGQSRHKGTADPDLVAAVESWRITVTEQKQGSQSPIVLSTPPWQASPTTAPRSDNVERFLPIQSHRGRGEQLFLDTRLFDVPVQKEGREDGQSGEVAQQQQQQQQRKANEMGRPTLPGRESSLKEEDWLTRRMIEELSAPRRGSDCSDATLV